MNTHQIKKQTEQQLSEQNQLLKVQSKPLGTQQLTFGQKLADKLATKVGSWPFLIGQTAVLTAWIGCNTIPGLPHWDESPFILLNLVFSFASAYTAPVVLMSQNRQSDEDRANAQDNYQVNLQTAHNIELLHEKLEQLYLSKLNELEILIREQKQQKKLVVLPTQQEVKLIPTVNFPLNQTPVNNIFFQQLRSNNLASNFKLEQNIIEKNENN